MSEIKITVYENSGEDCDLLLQNIRSVQQELDLSLDISVSESFFWITNREGHFKIYYSKCSFIETDNRNLLFHYRNEIIRKMGRISDILKKLPKNTFFRCNNSYIVNLNYINKITREGDRYNILLSTGVVIPLSRSRYQECLTLLQISNERQS